MHLKKKNQDYKMIRITKKKLLKQNKILKKENERLNINLDNSHDSLDKCHIRLEELEKENKENKMFSNAFSVLLAAVDERRLAWSLSMEYQRKKKEHERVVTNNNRLARSVRSLDLDKILGDVIGGLRK